MMRRGFTMLELLVVAGIMIMLSGVMVSFSRLGQDQLALYSEGSRLIQTVLQAKSLAISAYRSPGERITCAHGAYFDIENGTFALVRYLKKESLDGSPVPACAEIGSLSTTPISERYDRVAASPVATSLASGLSFREVGGLSDVIFRPPEPQTFLLKNGLLSDPAPTSGEVVIQSREGGAIRIVIGQAGQVTYTFED